MQTQTEVRKEVNLMAIASEKINREHNNLLDQLKGLEKLKRRTEALASLLQRSLPKKILNRIKIDFEGWENYVYVIISPKFNGKFTDHDTLLITDFCAKQSKWKFDKVINETTGKWKHELSRRVRYSCSYGIEFRTIGNIDGCEIEEVEETKVVRSFKVKC